MSPRGRLRGHSTATAHEHGFAVAAALLTIAVAGTIAAAVVEITRLEVVLARQRRATLAALAAVDACAAQAVGSLAVGWEFDDVLHGGDGVPGTSDDGTLPLPADCTGTALVAPGPPAPPRMLLELEASRGGGRRRLDAVVRRHPRPGVPALVWATNPSRLGQVTGTLTLDGVDGARPDDAWSALAAPGDPVVLDAWMATQGAALAVTFDTGAPIWTPPPPLVELASRAGAAGGVPPAVGLVATGPAAAAITLAAGDVTITTPLIGTGILIVQGVLAVEAPLEFTGVVAATGGLRVEAGGALDVRGALWLGDGALEAVYVAGSAMVSASATALDGADALLPLPRRAHLASVRDF